MRQDGAWRLIASVAGCVSTAIVCPQNNFANVMPSDSSPNADHLLEQACAWLAVWRSGACGEQQQREIQAWRRQSPDHEQAWRQANRVWAGMSGLRGRAIPGSDPLFTERYPQVPARTGMVRSSTGPARPVKRRRVRPAVAACLAMLTAGLMLAFPPTIWQADYLTATGGSQRVALSDGSTVTLNTGSAIAVSYDARERRIRLLKGEAYFEVAKDADYPFVVAAAGGEVRAVGTAFSVRDNGDGAAVELVEGSVDVLDAASRNRLIAGQAASFSAGRIEVRDGRIGDMALWRRGYLQFDALPLAQAVAEINRYRPGQVLLLNDQLAGQRISGLFRLDALDQAVNHLQTAVPSLRVTRITPYLTLLR